MFDVLIRRLFQVLTLSSKLQNGRSAAQRPIVQRLRILYARATISHVFQTASCRAASTITNKFLRCLLSCGGSARMLRHSCVYINDPLKSCNIRHFASCSVDIFSLSSTAAADRFVNSCLKQSSLQSTDMSPTKRTPSSSSSSSSVKIRQSQDIFTAMICALYRSTCALYVYRC